jgi:hypothetical protein
MSNASSGREKATIRRETECSDWPRMPLPHMLELARRDVPELDHTVQTTRCQALSRWPKGECCDGPLMPDDMCPLFARGKVPDNDRPARGTRSALAIRSNCYTVHRSGVDLREMLSGRSLPHMEESLIATRVRGKQTPSVRPISTCIVRTTCPVATSQICTFLVYSSAVASRRPSGANATTRVLLPGSRDTPRSSPPRTRPDAT